MSYKYYIKRRDIGIPTVPLAPAPIPAKPAKITPAIYRTAAYKAKRRESAKARATAYKLAKKKDLQRSKRTAGSNAGRYTTNSGLIANKDDNNAYNGAYVPLADIEEEEEEKGSSNDNGINGGTSDSTDKGKGSGIYKRSEGSSRCKVLQRVYVLSSLLFRGALAYAASSW
ncbi:hypothetical protein P8C59_003292 [Phyllachora maydis]|uniref:Uncharacterized protein n=1 Tax=Phyllachora maydis TaxID=1825666 RepID=A0AAD9I1J5_9PEZI|nr:hypothetical protein P8C59_003292 [Phyllachora maydis]